MRPIAVKSATFFENVSLDAKLHIKYSTSADLALWLFGGMLIAERKDRDTMVIPMTNVKEITIDGPKTVGEMFGGEQPSKRRK